MTAVEEYREREISIKEIIRKRKKNIQKQEEIIKIRDSKYNKRYRKNEKRQNTQWKMIE